MRTLYVVREYTRCVFAIKNVDAETNTTFWSINAVYFLIYPYDNALSEMPVRLRV